MDHKSIEIKMTIDELRYPVGKPEYPDHINEEHLDQWIETIASFPSQLEEMMEGVSDQQLSLRYRPEGWTVRQVIHHMADSHMNSYIRFKWAMTEDQPLIKAYDEQLWAKMFDGERGSIQPSLDLIRGLHARWAFMLRSFVTSDWEKSFVHPESGRNIRLDKNLCLYHWHCRHHLEHIRLALANK